MIIMGQRKKSTQEGRRVRQLPAARTGATGRMLAVFALVFLPMLLAGCGGDIGLVRPRQQLVAGSFQVTPTRAWNSLKPKGFYGRKRVALWTEDGESLDFVAWIAGMYSGSVLFQLPHKLIKKREVPVFRSSMLIPEVAEFIKASYARALGVTVFDILSLKPRDFGGHPGFVMEFRTVLHDEVPRRGLAAGAIVDGRLYLMLYQAAELHYYDRYRQDVLAMLDGLTLTPRRR
ncbi:MAG: hypothetical protein D6740_13585 [Alphaproteobacteria bacterium]|nr:MAG: hypothetical protein D6740_13585 [Alphaproteobacteria bacterium]